MNGYNVLKYGATGIATPDMSAYDKVRALAMAGVKYPVTTITGIPPIRFKSDGSSLDNVTIIGNGQQTGTPSPDNIIMPTFCGKLVGADWTIPITSAGHTIPVYLGEVPTVRRVKKLVLTGGDDENWSAQGAGGGATRFRYILLNSVQADTAHLTSICTHLPLGVEGGTWNTDNIYTISTNYLWLRLDSSFTTVSALKTWLASEYAAGHPVTVWYALETPTTGIVNEPLVKIGGYADELHSADAGVTIPTVRGSNVLTVDTDVQPSEMTITGHIKPL